MKTSPEIIKKLVSFTVPGKYVLEPSAGTGDLAIALKNNHLGVDCIELNKDNVWLLKKYGFLNVINGDFLNVPRI